jgi:protein-S-isoprenylcysteine O-methyltransferase Ste14
VPVSLFSFFGKALTIFSVQAFPSNKYYGCIKRKRPLAIAYFVTTELEDRELTERFGNQYQEYKKKVPKFFPKPKKIINRKQS